MSFCMRMEPSLTEPDEILLHKALTGALMDLSDARPLFVVELAADGIVSWEFRRDPAGVPQARAQPVASWHELYREPSLARAESLHAARITDGAAAIVVSTFPDGSPGTDALGWIRDTRPE